MEAGISLGPPQHFLQHRHLLPPVEEEPAESAPAESQDIPSQMVSSFSFTTLFCSAVQPYSF